MDPEAALQALRDKLADLKERVEEAPDDAGDGVDAEDVAGLVELAADVSELIDIFEGLDSWMSRGGFLPASWAAGRPKP